MIFLNEEHQEAVTFKEILQANHTFNPMSFYEYWQKNPNLYFDNAYQQWIAIHTEVVQHCLSHADFGVRPSGEAVPVVFLDTAIEALWKNLVRQQEGKQHELLKTAMTKALLLGEACINNSLEQVCQYHWELAPEQLTTASLNNFCLNFFPMVMLDLIGIALNDRVVCLKYLQQLTAGLRPSASQQDRRDSVVVYQEFIRIFKQNDPQHNEFLIAFRQCFKQAGLSEQQILDSLCGLCIQSIDSGAALISQALCYMSETQDQSAEHIVQHVLQYLLPIQWTRRFVLKESFCFGSHLYQGQCVLLILGATPTLAFGYGHHRCPGASWAVQIAKTAIQYAQSYQINHQLSTNRVWQKSVPHQP